MDLTLTTKDGDTVTISSSHSATTMAAAATAGSGAAAAFMRSESASVSIEIDGELDREEMQDLAKALKMLARAARRGDADKLQRRLAHADLDSVASLTASASQSVQVIAGVLTLAAPQPNAAQPPAPAHKEPPTQEHALPIPTDDAQEHILPVGEPQPLALGSGA